jgi:transposase
MQADEINLQLVHSNAAGIDIGNEAHYVAVPPDRDSRRVRRFGCTSAELRDMDLAQGMRNSYCGHAIYRSVLDRRVQPSGRGGLRGVSGECTRIQELPLQKSEVQESQWLMKLHTYGLLRNSFRPPQEIRTMRTYWRQRNDLIRSTGLHIQRIQKRLTQMNLPLANVLSDVSGVTGRGTGKKICYFC